VKTRQELVYSLKALGEFAANSNLDLCLVGGVPRNLIYKILYDENANLKNKDECSLDSESIYKLVLESELDYDIDLVINSSAALWLREIENHFDKQTKKRIEIIEEFKPFQTVKVRIEGLENYSFEFASARTEYYPHPASFPKVDLCSSLALDTDRRDFTINTLLISLNPNDFLKLIDYSSALDDMKNGLVRVFHPQSFIDDPTRIYRAFRFCLEYGFELEKNTEGYLKEALKNEDFPIWFKKRKNRFLIELEKYRKFIPVFSD